MTEVDANHASSFHIDHEVGEVAVSDAKNPVTDTQQSMRADEVGSQGQEGLRAVAHPQERPPAEWKQQGDFGFSVHTRVLQTGLTSAGPPARAAAPSGSCSRRRHAWLSCLNVKTS